MNKCPIIAWAILSHQRRQTKTHKTNNKSQKKRKETKRKYDGVRKGLRLQMNNNFLQFFA